MKFLFSCGGTAGHINPAIGVAGRLKQLMPDCEILFIGAEGMMETNLVPREGYEIKTVRISNISRSLSLAGVKHNLDTIKYVVMSTTEAKKIIKDFGADAVIGTGGYVCYPVLKAAHSLGIPTLVHESNAVPGLTTKMLAGIVDCVMVGFESAADNYSKGTNVVYTGTPVRTDFSGKDKAKAKEALGIPADEPLVVSVWGSLGSGHMNGIMEEFAPLAAEKRRFRLIHSAGKGGFDKLKTVLDASCPHRESAGVDVRPYIYDMPLVMAAADLVMCRSGASTLAELASLGKPALLVPSPNVTNNHQEKNARVLEKLGGARVHLEGEFTAQSLYDEVCDMLSDSEALARMAKAMSGASVTDSTDKIADIILGYVK
ncbi:MAG: UDP-N-acetylglucosamine--N-acetylmuramyl-(pentapeptide) pyrophosphoryl-undecaprenol N-acetylglucosamine transferase [Oscillospiraceae bacterium]|nr:UDP-N-acetylglucosamine--N-acetylmuramyl-(pentapeptide) pyrophosphoryl-undecaprenol N-acetylglucosamine transferase [Oscillospiraceae bacterium]